MMNKEEADPFRGNMRQALNTDADPEFIYKHCMCRHADAPSRVDVQMPPHV